MKVSRTTIKHVRTKMMDYFVNGVLVAKCKQGTDFFCTVSKSGNPSNVRNKVMRTFHTRWEHSGISLLIGENYIRSDFKDDYPDLKWGHQGSILTNKKVKQIFSKYIKDK